MAPRILIVDDIPDLRWALAECARRDGMDVQEAEDGDRALQSIRSLALDVVVLDVRMPGASGIETLREARRLRADLPIILVTAYAEVREAIEAIKAGAFDYLQRPFDQRELLRVIHSALICYPGGANGSDPDAPLLVRQMGSSELVRQLTAEVAQVACTDLTVVITGESGCGKELVARAIHAASRRSSGPFVAVDCGGIPQNLLENEFFGHEKGAFTGADRAAIGKFEAAAGGTLFLDEIGNLPVELQCKLLRALETREVFRIGGVSTRKVDVRVLAATNRDLGSSVAAGTFREDLFYRLCEYAIRVPALRERPEDIAFLAHRFLEGARHEFRRELRGFAQAALEAMTDYDWPGNVRELRNAVRRAALMTEDLVEVEHLRLPAGKGPGETTAADTESPGRPQVCLKELVRRRSAEIERQVLGEVLEQTDGNKARAARLLGIDYKTILTKIRQYGIVPRRTKPAGAGPVAGRPARLRRSGPVYDP